MSASPDSAPPIAGRFFDGTSAAVHRVTAALADGEVCIADLSGTPIARWPADRTAATGPAQADGSVTLACAGSPARLVLPDGRLLAQLPKPPPPPSRRWAWLALAAAGLLLAVVLLPFPAALVPAPVEDALGRLTADAFIGGRPVCRGTAGQAALDGLAARLAAAAGLSGQLVVRVIDTPDANAFALPGNRIVVLSGLFHRLRDPSEFAGVLAHEMGHLQHHDPVRRLGRTLGTEVLGQLTGAASAQIVTRLGLLVYDRADEARADAAALDLLRRARLRADGLSRFLGHMAESGSAMPAWLTDHPDTEARRVATEAEADGDAPLDSDGWQALRNICAGNFGQ
jgi:beta-barrel assembly-enhancing protease